MKELFSEKSTRCKMYVPSECNFWITPTVQETQQGSIPATLYAQLHVTVEVRGNVILCIYRF